MWSTMIPIWASMVHELLKVGNHCSRKSPVQCICLDLDFSPTCHCRVLVALRGGSCVPCTTTLKIHNSKLERIGLHFLKNPMPYASLHHYNSRIRSRTHTKDIPYNSVSQTVSHGSSSSRRNQVGEPQNQCEKSTVIDNVKDCSPNRELQPNRSMELPVQKVWYLPS